MKNIQVGDWVQWQYNDSHGTILKGFSKVQEKEGENKVHVLFDDVLIYLYNDEIIRKLKKDETILRQFEQ